MRSAMKPGAMWARPARPSTLAGTLEVEAEAVIQLQINEAVRKDQAVRMDDFCFRRRKRIDNGSAVTFDEQ